MKNTKKGVSVVIPSFNDFDKVLRLVESLKKSSFRNLEIIIVDNSPTKKIIQEGRRKLKDVRWIDAGRKNLGQGAVYNLGFANANKENHVLYCDSDVVVDRFMISRLLRRAEKRKKVGIVAPMILYLEDKDWVNQAGSQVSLLTGKVYIGWGPKKNFQSAKKVQGSGTVMLITRELLEKIGGLEDWFIGYMDPDYCVRSLKAGFQNWYEPTAVCYHDQPKEDKKWRPRVLSRSFYLGRNRTLFMRKHGNMLVYTFFLPVLLGYYLFESIRFGLVLKWFEMVWGTIVGYFYPVEKTNYIPLLRSKN